MAGPIVVATDLRARADRAIDRAIVLGRQLGRRVIMAHALDGKQAAISDPLVLDRQMKAVLPAGQAEPAQLQFAYPQGSVPTALAKLVADVDASLLVMGPARHNSLRDHLLGTAVDYTLRECEQPVLVVKQRPHHPYRTIVLATDFSAPSAIALQRALGWFPDAAVHVVHGCRVPFDLLQKADVMSEQILRACRQNMAAFVRDLALPEPVQDKLQTHVEPGSALDLVNRVAAAQGADLVVIGSQGESGFRHATLGSTANALLTATAVDTLVVTARE